ncbi:ATP-dependent DNA helicase RecQ [Capnocytophaga leadbetteri]|uniref:RecQ family ATP-dependent DNA helicase n=1 Tax=Capnocytophaga leadbetteri TaxID=327575 RepID=UPI0036F35451
MAMESPELILKKYWGFDSFRPPQKTVIESVLKGNDTLALMPTGGGKSITFQVPAMLKEGICIVVSPLIALMTDQVNALKNKGINAISLGGSLPYRELERLLNNALYSGCKFLYLSPERLQQEIVQNFLKVMNINLLVIDEAHCVSHWGKDFRPAYFKCQWLKEQFPTVPLLALTASATPKVQQDILKLLSIEKATIVSTSLARPNISYKVFKEDDKHHLLFQILKKNEGSVIIYTRSRNGTDFLASLLVSQGFTATFFHGGLTSEEKNRRLNLWLDNKVRIMVATNAFGMGIDKPDVRMVIHWNIPLTLEDYFQEAGRAGRDGKAASAIMIYNETDIETAEKLMGDYLIDIPFLKLVYTKLSSYFKIAVGEGINETYGFMFPDFCMQYELPTLKTYNALQVLDRFSVISLSQQFNNKVSFQLTAPISTLIEYDHTHRHLSATLFYLARTYPLIYSQPVVLDTAKITEYTDLNYYQLIDYLEQIDRDGMGVLKNEQSDVQITFNLPRDDDRTINSIGKNIKEYNHTKLALQQEVYRYLNNEKKCRSQQLLEYFGEKTTHPCGICSNCIAHHRPEKIDKKQVREELWELLKKAPIRPSDILIKMPYTEEVINPILEEWLTTEKIEFTVRNELFVK